MNNIKFLLFVYLCLSKLNLNLNDVYQNELYFETSFSKDQQCKKTIKRVIHFELHCSKLIKKIDYDMNLHCSLIFITSRNMGFKT